MKIKLNYYQEMPELDQNPQHLGHVTDMSSSTWDYLYFPSCCHSDSVDLYSRELSPVPKPSQNHPTHPASMLLDPASVVLFDVLGSELQDRPSLDHGDG